jgi:hypothetical protein
MHLNTVLEIQVQESMRPTFEQVYENMMKGSKHIQRSHKRC